MDMGKVVVNSLLIGALLLAAGCQEKGRSVADYIHDIDSARAVLKDSKAHPEKAYDADVVNASKAVAESMSPSMAECWPTKPSSTATVDHDCLNRKGFKR